MNDFVLVKALSSGAYGYVCLAKKKNTDDLFAIKVMDKDEMKKKGVVDKILNERDAMSIIDHHFVIRGVYTFQSKKFLYMVMEYQANGDLSIMLDMLHRSGQAFTRM